MFAHDQGWLRRMREAVALGPHRRGRGRARAVATTAPACCARPTPICASGCTTSTISPTACCASLVGRDIVATRGDAARERHPRRPLDGAGGAARLRPLAPARPRARGGRADEPHRHRGPRARHSGRRRGRERRPRSSSRATPSSSTAAPARCRSGRAPTSRPPMPRRRACAPAGRSSTGSCATLPAVTTRRRRDRPAPQCRPARRPAASRGDRGAPASACSAPSCSS